MLVVAVEQHMLVELAAQVDLVLGEQEASGVAGGNGTANRGGGGGGGAGAAPNTAGGAGGSGVVIIKIPDTRSATFTGGVTANGNTGGSITPDTSVAGYNIYVVTATSNTSQTVTFS
jgi:hypothetical protein